MTSFTPRRPLLAMSKTCYGQEKLHEVTQLPKEYRDSAMYNVCMVGYQA